MKASIHDLPRISSWRREDVRNAMAHVWKVGSFEVDLSVFLVSGDNEALALEVGIQGGTFKFFFLFF
jgi:hypothetical protein